MALSMLVNPCHRRQLHTAHSSPVKKTILRAIKKPQIRQKRVAENKIQGNKQKIRKSVVYPYS